MNAGAILGVVAVGIVLILLLFAVSGLRLVYQYQRGVIFVLGRLIGAKGPGVFWVPPLISQMRKIDLRVVTVELPPQEGVTHDNVTVGVSAVLFFYIVNPTDRRGQQCARLLPGDGADCADDVTQCLGPVVVGPGAQQP